MPEQQIPDALTNGEVDRFLNVLTMAPKLYQALFRVMLLYGPRASELGLIRKDDVDLGDDPTIKFTRVKNGRDNVWPLTREIADVIDEYLQERGLDVNPFLFRSRSLNSGIHRRTVWKTFRSYALEAGVHPRRCHPHSARHYAAVHALDRGLDMAAVQDLLGHRSIQSTQIYAQVSTARRMKAFTQLTGEDDEQRQANL